jgi:hypothetical protein
MLNLNSNWVDIQNVFYFISYITFYPKLGCCINTLNLKIPICLAVYACYSHYFSHNLFDTKIS